MGRSGQVVARERARAAKAKLDEQRAERDKKVEEAATDYYSAVGRLEDLEEQISAARAEMSAAVVALGELGEPVDRVATLCGLTVSEVRALKRAGKASGSGGSKSAGADDEAAVSNDE